MCIVATLQRLLAGDAHDEETTDADPGDSDPKTTIDDAEATSLRAIKLPDAEREALDAEDRDP
jgi:hypothetical protein